ncbi:hypothetical protein HMPREF0043_00436 [Actinobaculum sp. oral taxon 183 str. F0552]|nr:hypothetical protein HMPREF0043_00436 [Actinobaculum sp. oral taxon 183 str. F0552]
MKDRIVDEHRPPCAESGCRPFRAVRGNARPPALQHADVRRLPA